MRYVSNMTKVEVHKGQAMPWLEETTNFESDTIDSDKGWCYLCYQLALTMNCGIINTKNSAENIKNRRVYQWWSCALSIIVHQSICSQEVITELPSTPYLSTTFFPQQASD